MTKDFETLLCLFGDSSLGRKSRISSVDNPDKLIDMAVKQGIWSCIYPMLDEICDVKKYYFDFLAYVSKSIARNEFTLNVLDEAMKKGIEVCILKGAAIASLYANPDYRISSDTDILIQKKDEKKMAKFLISKGYDVEKRDKNDHHMKAYHKIGGLLEIHISLYSKLTDKIIFEGRDMYSEPWMLLKIGEKELYTLGINDNFIYLTAHYIKHFLNGGSSIRQMMDLLLYMKKYESEIDFEKYNELMKKLRFNKLIESVILVGKNYFGIEITSVFDEETSCMEELLNDSERCGLFGNSSDKPTSVYNKVCERRKSVSAFKLKYFLLFKTEKSFLKRLFPSQKELVNLGYSYAKHKVFTPLAWCHRIIDRILKRNVILNERTDIGLLDNRIEMMKKLSIID